MADTKNNKTKLHMVLTSIFRVLLVIIFVIAIVAPFNHWLERKTEGRIVLLKAKANELAVLSTALEYYGTNQQFLDQTEPFGITAKAQTAIQQLSDCDGDYYVLQWDSDNFCVKKSVYVENGYMVVYTLHDNGEKKWQMYHTEPMLAE